MPLPMSGNQGADEDHGEDEGYAEDDADELALELQVHEEPGHQSGLGRRDDQGQEHVDQLVVEAVPAMARVTTVRMIR